VRSARLTRRATRRGELRDRGHRHVGQRPEGVAAGWHRAAGRP
jgi:hypothetical protein